MKINHFSNTLLHWYPLHKRDLPWRTTKDPYIIWLSEIILQQTRVAQGLPYFERFAKQYPTVHDLAQAPASEILRMWQGLGYYSRARNLHQCAREVVNEHKGRFPGNYKELLKLKGVGSYTAAAIASFAFGEKVAVLDGNVFRVLGRYFGVETDIASTSGKKKFTQLANQVLPDQNSDEYNQAIMEFGALQCTPKNPSCDNCPLQASCFAYQKDLVSDLPVKLKKVKVTTRAFLYHHIFCDQEVIVNERGPKDIWQGLTDFPLVEFDRPEKINPEESSLIQELQQFKPVIETSPEKTYKHILTHQKIFSNFVTLSIPKTYRRALGEWARQKGFFLCPQEELDQLGKPNLIVRYLNDKK